MFWIGFGVGVIVGGVLGFFAYTLCCVAKICNSEDKSE
jgi:hypothetical protein